MSNSRFAFLLWRDYIGKYLAWTPSALSRKSTLSSGLQMQVKNLHLALHVVIHLSHFQRRCIWSENKKHIHEILRESFISQRNWQDVNVLKGIMQPGHPELRLLLQVRVVNRPHTVSHFWQQNAHKPLENWASSGLPMFGDFHDSAWNGYRPDIKLGAKTWGRGSSLRPICSDEM